GMGLFSNGFIFDLLEPRYISWIKNPGKSITIAITAHVIYSSIIIFGVSWIYFGKLLNTPDGQFWNYYKYTLISVFVITVFITAIIYLKSFFKAYRNEAIEAEKLKQEAISLQYQIMQNQVNPHFLFNALNILGTLVDIDTQKSKEFIRELSLFYRELLNFKDKEIIPIQEEISFITKYIYLQKIRFANNFEVEILINENLKGNVIPMSIQMLLENAVKHNIITKNKPLKVTIGKLDGDEIFIENKLQPKKIVAGSNIIGLKNLQKRYKFLTNIEMIVEENNGYFRVTIPLIKLDE
ncbi:MAG: histidine kinase, partial [Prolixibacteraceae bacterium]|nr:histidine kinase [Prolixibacteraceae bacterium]